MSLPPLEICKCLANELGLGLEELDYVLLALKP